MSVDTVPLPYPLWMESWWISFAKQMMKEDEDFRLFERLANEVQQLSDRFIADDRREKLRGYGQERDTLLAYGLFFFPQTFTRALFPMAETWFRGWRPNESLRILDIGAGLGSASLGLVHWLKMQCSELSISVDALEQSQQSLDWYKQLTEDLGDHFPSCQWQMHRGNLCKLDACQSLQHVEQKWDLIIASFSLNEAFEARSFEDFREWVDTTLQKLRPGGLLMILEPASRVACERLELLRDQVVKEGEYALWGPCLHTRSCPLLEDGRLWCHEVRSWPVPDSLKWLNRRMFRAIESIKFGFLVIGEKTQTPDVTDDLSLRMISPMTAKKGRWLGTGCTSHGERLPLEIQTRQLNQEDKALYKRVERGDLMFVQTDSELETHPKTGLVRLPKNASFGRLFPEDD